MMRFAASSLSFLPLVLANVKAAANEDSFDFVIVGGGTSGLVLANRLSENPIVTVAVIEAGDSVLHNPNVTQIENFFASLDSPIDWLYESQPQQYTGNRKLPYYAGKALGGTSTINGATYVRAQKSQIDAWERLGNTGWNWDILLPYYKKSERLQPPDAQLTSDGATYEASVHGFNGPLDVGWSKYTEGQGVGQILNETWQALNIPHKNDQSDGDLHGFSIFPSTIDSVHSIRADAARSYYWPVSERKNLHVFTSTLAEKLTWKEDGGQSGGLICANGVQIRPISGGASRIIKAAREVIVSMGSLKSPIILENSGVGNPAILSKHGIETKVNLPAVGENLQDQPMAVISATAKTNWTGYTPFVTYVTASDLFGSNTSNVASYISDQIPGYGSAIAAQNNNAYGADVIEMQLRIQADIIFNQSTPIMENIMVPANTSVSATFWGLLPFSRGSVHLSSANASSYPLINPNFFMVDWDAILNSAAAKLSRRALHSGPLSKFVGADVLPNTTVVPEDAGVEQWTPWLKESCKSSIKTLFCFA